MRDVVDLLSRVTASSGSVPEGFTWPIIRSVSYAGDQRLLWITSRRTKVTMSYFGMNSTGNPFASHAMTVRQRAKMGDGRQG